MKSDAWAKKLMDICSFVDERISVSGLNLDTYISTVNMLPHKGGITHSAGLPRISHTQAYQTGDVLISNIRPYFRKIWLADRGGGCSNDVLVLRANQKIDTGFLYYLLSDDSFFNYMTATAKGTKMPRGDKAAIMQYEVPDLPLNMQIVIANILSVFDDKINLNKRINHHLAGSMSETDNSPDIRRGRRVSRMVARRADSFELLRMVA